MMKKSKLSRRITWHVIGIMSFFNVLIIGAILVFVFRVSLINSNMLIGAGVGELPCDTNIPVGIMPTWGYSLQGAQIFTDTTIFLFTDGLTEAMDASKAMFHAAPETEKAMSPLYDVEGKDIIIDCTELEYISSAGLRIFLAILLDTEVKGGNVYIKGINNDLREIFTITGFIKLFKFM